jgi:type I restriction enzyme S subunit
MFVEKLITGNLDIWASAIKTKSASGRGSSKKLELYGIKKLRELILELAVRGKLVPQDTNDEPADKLLERIAIEKEQLIKDKKIKKQKPLPPVEDNECVYEIPNTWVWTRLGDVTNYGMALKAEPKDVDEFTWVLELEDVEKVTSKLLKKVRYKDRPFKSSKNIFYEGDVIYGKLRPYLDKVLVAGENGVCTTEMIPLRGYKHIEPTFLRLLLKSPKFIEYANASTHGMNLPRMGTDKARLAALPLAPENEQKRIVAKVDELMDLCDQLESQTEASIEAHQALVKTLLETLTNAKDAYELNESWQRISEHFDVLFTTEDSIDQLKQTILQLAVMGKLVKQDPNDEPASKLLERIAAEKEQLIKDKKIKKQKPFSTIIDEEKPLELPHGWKWARLGDLSSNIHYGYTASAKPENEGIRLLRITDIQDDKVNWETVPGCEITDEKSEGYSLENNDILIARTGGTIGKSYLVENINVKAVFASYLIRVKRISAMYSPFIKTYLGSSIYWSQLYDNASGTGQPNVNATALKQLLVPVAPLNEQKRIVAKVEALMILCDSLKARLKDAQITQLHFTEAIVEQAS